MIDKRESINSDLSVPPADPVEALNYPELFALWKANHDRSERGEDWSAPQFQEWDTKVKNLLRPKELERFVRPRRNDWGDTQGARLFHLTKVLWARQGVENYMDDTGE